MNELNEVLDLKVGAPQVAFSINCLLVPVYAKYADEDGKEFSRSWTVAKELGKQDKNNCYEEWNADRINEVIADIISGVMSGGAMETFPNEKDKKVEAGSENKEIKAQKKKRTPTKPKPPEVKGEVYKVGDDVMKKQLIEIFAEVAGGSKAMRQHPNINLIGQKVRDEITKDGFIFSIEGKVCDEVVEVVKNAFSEFE